MARWGGGGWNRAGDDAGTVDDAPYATVGGGYGNTASGGDATVGGGYDNSASDGAATVGGGHGNTASAKSATVGGGSTNTASVYYATVGGGYDNTASGVSATVGGGEGNSALDYFATVGGGDGNSAGGGYGATVGGGEGNTASGENSTVGGGQSNTASGHYATVPGGVYNSAAGDCSFAAGRRARTNPDHPGAFVWADLTDQDFSSTAANQFLVRASGGVGINTNEPIANTLTVAGDGVRSETGATTGAAMHGHASATSGATYGVHDVSDSSSGTGVYGEATVSSGTTAGVLGRAATGVSWGAVGWNDFSGAGVGAWSESGDLIQALASDFPGGTLRFKVDQSGNVHYNGSLMPFVALPSHSAGQPEHVSLYGLVSTEVWFEDLGSASLTDGRAEIVIDPLFAQTVSLTETYNIYLTATCQEPVLLFVSEKAAGHFTVQGVSLNGQPSRCGFDYRLAAKRLGYEGLRLEAVEIEGEVGP